jgi:DNA-binding IclR family transcriptional regulator
MSPLSKVFSIIENVVAKQDKGVTYSEIVATLKLPKSSVHRILKDLTALGYLNFNPETKKYLGSLRLAALGAEVMSNFQLRDHIRPYLLELHRETEHTTNLAVLDGLMGVFVDKIESKDFGIKLFSEIGKTFPLHCTGLGKALLAFSSADVASKLLEAPLEAITENTITDPEAFKRELALIQQQGYASDYGEITRGIICVAAPVFGFNQEMICSISITMPAYINDDRGIEAEIGAIRRYSELISESFITAKRLQHADKN